MAHDPRGSWTCRSGGNPEALALSDVNEDGILDIITANNATGDIAVLQGAGDGSFTLPAFFSLGANPSSLAVGGFNADGWMDIVTEGKKYGDTIHNY